MSPTGSDDTSRTFEEELQEAQGSDLSQFQASGPGFERDAFEDWVRISRRHEVLEHEETDRLVEMLASDDPEVVEYATDRLVRHNIKWVVHCLRKYAGAELMNRPSDIRDDLLSLGRMAFLEALRKYDPERAVKRGKTDNKKSILKYSEFWIRKRVGEYLKRERFGLNEEAALDRKKVVEARRALKKAWGRQPTPEEIADHLEEAAHRKLEEAGVEPTAKRLRRKGAIGVDRVRELLRHRTDKASFDAPAVSGDDDSPTLAEYIESSDTSAEETVAARDRRRRLEEVLRKTPSRKDFLIAAMSHGLRGEDGQGRHEMLNPEEIGLVIGRTRDTTHTYLDRYRRAFRGEREVAVDDLVHPDLDLCLGELKEEQAEAGSLGAETRSVLARAVDLSAVVAEDLGRGSRRCPFNDCGAASLAVADGRYACDGCGREGDVFDWLEQVRGLSADEAELEVGRRALELPEWALQASTVEVVSDRRRRKALTQLG